MLVYPFHTMRAFTVIAQAIPTKSIAALSSKPISMDLISFIYKSALCFKVNSQKIMMLVLVWSQSRP